MQCIYLPSLTKTTKKLYYLIATLNKSLVLQFPHSFFIPRSFIFLFRPIFPFWSSSFLSSSFLSPSSLSLPSSSSNNEEPKPRSQTFRTLDSPNPKPPFPPGSPIYAQNSKQKPSEYPISKINRFFTSNALSQTFLLSFFFFLNFMYCTHFFKFRFFQKKQ